MQNTDFYLSWVACLGRVAMVTIVTNGTAIVHSLLNVNYLVMFWLTQDPGVASH